VAEVRFYQLSRDPVERVVPLLAAKVLEQGERLVIVSSDPAQRAALSEAMWAREGAFLAHGEAGEAHAERQPILLSETCEAANGAAMVMIADGQWRDGAAVYERAILIFGAEQTGEARALWSKLSDGGHTLRIFKQGEAGGWREGR
jgi:DNA polymerase III subunit chi